MSWAKTNDFWRNFPSLSRHKCLDEQPSARSSASLRSRSRSRSRASSDTWKIYEIFQQPSIHLAPYLPLPALLSALPSVCLVVMLLTPFPL